MERYTGYRFMSFNKLREVCTFLQFPKAEFHNTENKYYVDLSLKIIELEEMIPGGRDCQTIYKSAEYSYCVNMNDDFEDITLRKPDSEFLKALKGLKIAFDKYRKKRNCQE